MKKLVSFGLVLLFLVSLGAVPVFYENYAEALGILQKEPTPWARSYGGSGYDEANAVALAPNGDIILVGHYGGTDWRGSDADVWVLRLDGNGNIVWQKTYGERDSYWANSAVVDNTTGDIIVVGYTNSTEAGDKDVWVLRLDGNGNIVWQKTYGGNNDDEADAVAITQNGNIVVAGTYGGYTWVLELDGNGNIVWQKAYRFYAVINAVAIDSNGNIIVAGTNSDFWVLKLNGNGDFEWQKSWGISRAADEATSVAIDNGDIVVAGYTWGFGTNGDFWVFRLDGNGNVIWQKTYGGNSEDEANAVAVTNSGDIIVAGYTYSFGAGRSDVWVLRLDGNGNIVWQKTYGGNLRDRANVVAMAPNGDIIVAGFTESFGAGNYDVWALRILPDGYLPSEGIRNLGFHVSDSNAIVGATNAISSSYTPTPYDTSVSEKFTNVIPQDTNAVVETQYYYAGPTELSFTSPTPENGSVLTSDYVFVNVTSNNLLESAKLEWNGENITMDKASDTNWYFNVTDLTNGEYTFKVWGKDLSEKWVASEVRTVTVNRTIFLSFVPPTPADGAVVNVDSVVINVTSSQPLESAVVEWDGENFTMHRESSESWYLALTGLSNGHYTFRVWGNDSLGNWFSSEARTITVNSTVVLSFVPPTPENGAVVDTDRVLINVSSGRPLKTVLLEWNGRNLTMQSASNTNWYIEMTNLTNGYYTFRAWGEDQLGNWFSSGVRSIAVNRTISLSFVSPTPKNNSSINSDYVFVNVTSDRPLEIALLEWNGHNLTMHNTSSTNWYLNITGLTNGHYEFRAWGRDSLGNWFSTEVRTVTVNSTVVLSFAPPTPEDGAVVNTDYVLVNVTSGQPLQVAKLEWNGQNLTMEMLSNTSWYLNVTNLTNGRYTFRAWGRDSLGNWFASGIRTIAVNRTITLSFVPPTPGDGDVLNSDSVFINVTSSQPLESALLEWDGKNFTMNNASGTNWYFNMTGLKNGLYTLRVWGRDSLGNWFSTEVRSVTIKVNTQSTYDIWIKLSCLWTTWFFNHRTEFFELYENATVLGVDNETIQLALELNDNATALMLGAWGADNLEDIRANLWNFESPTRRIPRLWDIRKAFLIEKEAVEILRKALGGL